VRKVICSVCQGLGKQDPAHVEGGSFQTFESPCWNCHGSGRASDPIPASNPNAAQALESAVTSVEIDITEKLISRAINHRPSTVLLMVKQVLKGQLSRDDFWADIDGFVQTERKYDRTFQRKEVTTP
jgi:hypothetical protein